ncbi:ABC transporter substrate-binding protein [Paenibacillus sp. P25]|nr:ABC transporter substrate-binding protein [Paenibacillus sp. P25]
MNKALVWTVVLCCTAAVAGCSAGPKEPADTGSSDSAAGLSKDPVTVKIMMGGLDDNEFQKYIVEPVSKKYPQITVERVGKNSKLPDMVAAGDIPDIVSNYPGPMASNLRDYKLVYNMEPLMKKYKFDTGRFAPEVLETLKIAGGQDYLAGSPLYTNTFALFYNKDIFDKFGVPYPKDGMYWDEVAELGQKLTRMDNGVQIRGSSRKASAGFSSDCPFLSPILR